ncbi:MAG: trigger factor [Firmicutes bacterium]|nr:trigger factor [Bacillota bacterium]
MTTSLEKLGNSRVKLTVTIDADELEKTIDEAYRRTSKRITLPGFRKGRAPRQLIELNYGPNVFLEDALDILLPRAYDRALQETEIQPVDQPVADVEQLERGVGATLTYEVDVYPELELGEYKGLKAERTVVEVTDEDVQQVLEQQQERAAQLVGTDRTTVQEGDFVLIDFLGKVDGQPFSGGAAEDHRLLIGSQTFIPGFEEALVGFEVGQTDDITVTFPEDYHAEHLAGKEAVFTVTVKELKVKQVPALDDEFAKDISQFETLDELKAEIRKNLEDEATRRTTVEVENKLLEQIADNSKVELPKSMIVHQAEHLVEDFLQNIQSQGLTEERYLEITGQTREGLREQFEPQAEKQIVFDLIIGSIIEKEGITVSEEEVDSQIDEYLGSTSDMEEEMVARLREYWNAQRRNIEISLQREKALKFLVDNAEITEVTQKEAAEEE